MHDENTRQESDLQEPLCGPEVDCRGLDFMPLAVAQLRDSDLVAISSGDGFKAAVLLWAKSWWEIPAGSLLNNDRSLARGAGITEREFLRIKSEALHGWVACSDGRLYNPLIVDFAEKAAKKRRDQSERANSRWAKEKAKSVAKTAKPKSPRTSAGNAAAYAPAMQGRGTVKREGEEETLRDSESPTLRAIDGGKSAAAEKIPAHTFDTWKDEFGDPLSAHFEDERQGVKRAPERRHLRPADCWFMAVGVLVVVDGLDEKAARKVVAQLFRSVCDENPEILAQAALATWRKATGDGLRRAQPYFASVCNSAAGEQRHRM